MNNFVEPENKTVWKEQIHNGSSLLPDVCTIVLDFLLFSIHLYDLVDVKDTKQEWLSSIVIATNQNLVRIHYLNWVTRFLCNLNKKQGMHWDEWLQSDDKRIMPLGHYSGWTHKKDRVEWTENELRGFGVPEDIIQKRMKELASVVCKP